LAHPVHILKTYKNTNSFLSYVSTAMLTRDTDTGILSIFRLLHSSIVLKWLNMSPYRWLTAQRCYVHFDKIEILIPGDSPSISSSLDKI